MVYQSKDLVFDLHHIVNTSTRHAIRVGFPQYDGIGCSLDKCYSSKMTCNFCNYCNFSLV